MLHWSRNRWWGSALWMSLVLTACGPDLAEIETRQQALRGQVDVLAVDVERMRTKMQEMGMIPPGPVPTASAGPTRTVDLGLTVERVGDPPALPPVGPIERRGGTPCGYRMRSVPLAEISDRRLAETGSGPSSPVTVSYGGRALTPHAGPMRVEQGCHGAFRLQPRFLFLSPFALDDVEGTWTVGLAAEQPVRRGDGVGVYWVYPGTALTFAFAKPWNPADGAFTVHLDARLLNVGQAPASPAVVQALGATAEAIEGRLAAPAVAKTPEGPWSVRVASPADGPYVLIDAFWVGNEGAGLIISPEAS